MIKLKLLLCLTIIIYLVGCKPTDPTDEIKISEKFDIILIIGQSNTHYGIGLDSALDYSDARIKQLGRFDDRDLQIVDAVEPLDHQTRIDGRIGFGITFSKFYADTLIDNISKILIIPCGYAGTGFNDHHWNKGDDLYTDAIERVEHVFKTYPGSDLKVILWHQGEDDLNDPDYQTKLDAMILNIRNDLNLPDVPFILGGMVPYFAGINEVTMHQQNIIKETTQRIVQTGYADPSIPFIISKANNEYDYLHFDAAGQREMGKRYFKEYVRLLNEK